MKEHIGNETFMLTCGDKVANMGIRKLVEFYRSNGKIAIVCDSNVLEEMWCSSKVQWKV